MPPKEEGFCTPYKVGAVQADSVQYRLRVRSTRGDTPAVQAQLCRTKIFPQPVLHKLYTGCSETYERYLLKQNVSKVMGINSSCFLFNNDNLRAL